MSSTGRRSAVTGVGVVAPGGVTRDAFWELVTSGRTATRGITVVVSGDAGWVQLERVPGFATSLDCELLDHAFVQADDLTFPR